MHGLIILPIANYWPYTAGTLPHTAPPGLPALSAFHALCLHFWLQGPTVGPAAGDLWGG